LLGKVLESIEQGLANEENDVAKKMKGVEEKLKKETEEIKSMMKRINTIWKMSEGKLVPLEFSQTLHHPSI
jgi:hypothetical protein